VKNGVIAIIVNKDKNQEITDTFKIVDLLQEDIRNRILETMSNSRFREAFQRVNTVQSFNGFWFLFVLRMEYILKLFIFS